MSKTLVVGFGSHHGDDRAGWLAVDMLLSRPDRESRAIALAEPTRLLDFLDGQERLILIDATRSGQVPGTIRRLTWPSPAIEPGLGHSSHGFDVALVLRMADGLRKLPPEVIIFGLEAGPALPGDDLSPPVVRALPELCARLRQEISRNG